MYEFHDKMECEKALEGSNGILDHKYNKNVKYFSLKGYEILVDVKVKYRVWYLAHWIMKTVIIYL